MKKTLFTATLLAASLMAASTVQAAPQEVTMWHYFRSEARAGNASRHG